VLQDVLDELKTHFELKDEASMRELQCIQLTRCAFADSTN
jgi:hypothetical protein